EQENGGDYQPDDGEGVEDALENLAEHGEGVSSQFSVLSSQFFSFPLLSWFPQFALGRSLATVRSSRPSEAWTGHPRDRHWFFDPSSWVATRGSRLATAVASVRTGSIRTSATRWPSILSMVKRRP